MTVVCISGKAQHGKDTVAVMMKKHMEEKGCRVLIAHYADLVKYVCRTFFEWNGEKDVAGRSLLQKIGTDCIRSKDPDYWVKFIYEIIKFFPDKWDYVLIPDTRFPNEEEFWKNHMIKTVHVHIFRQGFKSPLTEEQQMHPSETAMDYMTPDYFIFNKGTLEDLDMTAATLVENMGWVCERI